jgi:hypothetical protein
MNRLSHVQEGFSQYAFISRFILIGRGVAAEKDRSNFLNLIEIFFVLRSSSTHAEVSPKSARVIWRSILERSQCFFTALYFLIDNKQIIFFVLCLWF